MKDLASHLYGNPHSQNPSSLLSTDSIDGIRELVLNHFNTDSTHYDIVFTSGCTAALKLLAESFPWSRADINLRTTQQSIANNEENDHQTETQLTSSSEGNTCHTGMRSLEDSHHSGNLTNEPQQTKVMYLPDTQMMKEGGSDESFHTVTDDGSSVFCYLEDNHTSVVGMRELARHHGVRIICTAHKNIQLLDSTENQSTIARCTDLQTQTRFHLFAYPAQSNFSGQKYPLSWSNDLPSGKVCISGLEDLPGSWMVVLDAASHVCTSPLDLSSNPAQFVTLSFYKMFGYPTGLGALLVRNDCAHLLGKDYYGGGTVLATVSRTGFHVPRPQLHDRYCIAVTTGLLKVNNYLDNSEQV